MYMLPNISRSKGNHAIKLGQLKEYNQGKKIFKNNVENDAGRLVPDLFIF